MGSEQVGICVRLPTATASTVSGPLQLTVPGTPLASRSYRWWRSARGRRQAACVGPVGRHRSGRQPWHRTGACRTPWGPTGSRRPGLAPITIQYWHLHQDPTPGGGRGGAPADRDEGESRGGGAAGRRSVARRQRSPGRPSRALPRQTSVRTRRPACTWSRRRRSWPPPGRVGRGGRDGRGSGGTSATGRRSELPRLHLCDPRSHLIPNDPPRKSQPQLFTRAQRRSHHRLAASARTSSPLRPPHRTPLGAS